MSDEARAAMEGDQYLTFTLAGEQYAIGVHEVKEVLEFTSVTRVPRTRAFMRGVINLRGSVVPVIDLRLKFGMEATEKTIATSIVVLEVKMSGSPVTVGALADSVQEVVTLDAQQIEAPPRIGTTIDTEFIHGIGKQDDRFVIILDFDSIFSDEDILSIAEDAATR